MRSVDFREKYLKYKKKYMNLKQQTQQRGGFPVNSPRSVFARLFKEYIEIQLRQNEATWQVEKQRLAQLRNTSLFGLPWTPIKRVDQTVVKPMTTLFDVCLRKMMFRGTAYAQEAEDVKRADQMFGDLVAKDGARVIIIDFANVILKLEDGFLADPQRQQDLKDPQKHVALANAFLTVFVNYISARLTEGSHMLIVGKPISSRTLTFRPGKYNYNLDRIYSSVMKADPVIRASDKFHYINVTFDDPMSHGSERSIDDFIFWVATIGVYSEFTEYLTRSAKATGKWDEQQDPVSAMQVLAERVLPITMDKQKILTDDCKFQQNETKTLTSNLYLNPFKTVQGPVPYKYDCSTNNLELHNLIDIFHEFLEVDQHFRFNDYHEQGAHMDAKYSDLTEIDNHYMSKKLISICKTLNTLNTNTDAYNFVTDASLASATNLTYLDTMYLFIEYIIRVSRVGQRVQRYPQSQDENRGFSRTNLISEFSVVRTAGHDSDSPAQRIARQEDVVQMDETEDMDQTEDDVPASPQDPFVQQQIAEALNQPYLNLPHDNVIGYSQPRPEPYPTDKEIRDFDRAQWRKKQNEGTR